MLSPKAQQLIHDYLNLPFKGLAGVRCPYFNNARAKQRGQLRVLIGKGLPKEIVEEAHIISIQYHAGWFEKDGACCLHNEHTGRPITANDLRKFLIDKSLGIECSGFVTHVLRAHYRETAGVDIAKKLFITPPKHFLRWLISKLRPVENMDVRVYASEKNSTPIIGPAAGYDYSRVQPGDVIIVLEKTKPFRCNHIMLVTENNGQALGYIHARYWSAEGRYGPGVTPGSILITAPGKPLLEQTWNEKNLTGEANETYAEAKTAAVVEIRRLTIRH